MVLMVCGWPSKGHMATDTDCGRKDVMGSHQKNLQSAGRDSYGPTDSIRRCHELQYSDFDSVQGLLESMREYQHMAPSKLSDANLESILWSKVPYVIQREVGEMKEWTLNELFQRLLKAES